MRPAIRSRGGGHVGHFNPRTPCGVRPCPIPQGQSQFSISIHAPLAGRDGNLGQDSIRPIDISIHAPLAGRDHQREIHDRPTGRFQSTRPLRGATFSSHKRDSGAVFQSTRPLRGATSSSALTAAAVTISIHAPLAGRDTGYISRSLHSPISIHAPLAGRDSKLDEFLSANLRKSNKRDLLSEEKMRHGLPRTTCMSHFRSFFGCEAEAVFCPLALRT